MSHDLWGGKAGGRAHSLQQPLSVIICRNHGAPFWEPQTVSASPATGPSTYIDPSLQVLHAAEYSSLCLSRGKGALPNYAEGYATSRR